MDGQGRSTTNNRTRKVGAAVAAAAAAAGMALASAPAEASTQATWPNDTWYICDYAPGPPICDGKTYGGILWGNRTATLQGELIDYSYYGTTVYFDAFAGTTKVDSDHRDSGPAGDIPYHFTIGDPDLVGGVDRVRIQVCRTGTTQCSIQINVKRDSIPEYWKA